MKSVADLGFPRGGEANSRGGRQHTDFVKISQKLHEIERIWTPRGERASKILLCRSATGNENNNHTETNFPEWTCSRKLNYMLKSIKNPEASRGPQVDPGPWLLMRSFH